MNLHTDNEAFSELEFGRYFNALIEKVEAIIGRDLRNRKPRPKRKM